MAYRYEDLRPQLFTEEGQRGPLAIRDAAFRLTALAGAVMAVKLMEVPCPLDDTWLRMACIDRLVELKELVEITDATVAGQYRVFVARVRQ